MSAHDEPFLTRILERCHAQRWTLADMALDGPAPALTEEQEAAVVQYLTDFVFIERMAGAFFEAMRRKVDHPLLQAIYACFVDDETRHAHVMQLLADRYDRRHLQVYSANPHLVRLTRSLTDWIRLAPPDAAAAAVMVGEVTFDVAYVKPLDDYLSDPIATAALRRVHLDESRHIAVDYYMLDYYGSAAYSAWLAGQPVPSLGERARITAAFLKGFAAGVPFMRQVFFGSGQRVDPDGVRMRDAAKRVQLAVFRGELAQRGFGRTYLAVQQIFDHPVLGPGVRRMMGWALNADSSVFTKQYTEADRRRAARVSGSTLARDTVATFCEDAAHAL